jgi:hypothetical protein
MRQILSTALVALIVGALAGMTASTIAQTPEEEAIAPSAVTVANADKVDGKHAVGYTIKKPKRAGKLVATNAGGMLPPNIVKPFWAAIQNKPAGFADGVDDGVTGLKVTRVVSALGTAFGPGNLGFSPQATCPSGSFIVGGGASITGFVGQTELLSSYPVNATEWTAVAYKETTSSGNAQLQTFALCLSIESGGPITTARTGKAVRTSTDAP